jgi:hypothetical protein
MNRLIYSIISLLTGVKERYMNYLTHNDKQVPINCTSLQGYIDASYDHLCDLFGEPIRQWDEKVTCEWEVEFDDGTVANVYNWKTSADPERHRNWHIGGHDKRAVELVTALVG